MRTVVVGLGNPILSDDSVGIRVAAMLKQAPENGMNVVEAYAGGLRLLEAMVGYERAVIIDAVKTGETAAGTITCFTPGHGGGTRNLLCTHDSDLETSLALGRELGLNLPAEISIIGIEADDVERFSEELTPAVQAALPAAVAAVLALCRDENTSRT